MPRNTQNKTTRSFSDEQTRRLLGSFPSRVSSASLVLEDATGQAIVVKANYKSYWTFPGGLIDPQDTPLSAAIRETKEEIGLTINPADVSFVSVVNRKSSIAQTYQFIFTAKMPPRAKDNIVLQPSEIDEFAIVSKDQALAADRYYGKAVLHWAQGKSGYIEQQFDEMNPISGGSSAVA